MFFETYNGSLRILTKFQLTALMHPICAVCLEVKRTEISFSQLHVTVPLSSSLQSKTLFSTSLRDCGTLLTLRKSIDILTKYLTYDKLIVSSFVTLTIKRQLIKTYILLP